MELLVIVGDIKAFSLYEKQIGSVFIILNHLVVIRRTGGWIFLIVGENDL